MAMDLSALANAIVSADLETATALTQQGIDEARAEGTEDLVAAK